MIGVLGGQHARQLRYDGLTDEFGDLAEMLDEIKEALGAADEDITSASTGWR